MPTPRGLRNVNRYANGDGFAWVGDSSSSSSLVLLSSLELSDTKVYEP